MWRKARLVIIVLVAAWCEIARGIPAGDLMVRISP
jgi:hypothetical protein